MVQDRGDGCYTIYMQWLYFIYIDDDRLPETHQTSLGGTALVEAGA